MASLFKLLAIVTPYFVYILTIIIALAIMDAHLGYDILVYGPISLLIYLFGVGVTIIDFIIILADKNFLKNGRGKKIALIMSYILFTVGTGIVVYRALES